MAKHDTIFRTTKDSNNPYVMINKIGMEDKRLSWKARGILAFLLSKPNDWEVNLEHLQKQSPDGKTALRSGVDELKKCGYLVRVAIREDNKIKDWEFWVNETPLSTPVEKHVHIQASTLEEFIKQGRSFYVYTPEGKTLDNALLTENRKVEKTLENTLLTENLEVGNLEVGNLEVGNGKLLNNELLNNENTLSNESTNNDNGNQNINKSTPPEETNTVVVVETKLAIFKSFQIELDNKEITALIKLATKHQKKLSEVISETEEYFTTADKPITNLFGALRYGIETGWAKPKQAKTKLVAKRKQLPKTIAKEIEKPAFTDEELQGTYEDIQATMKFLRSTEKQVLHAKE